MPELTYPFLYPFGACRWSSDAAMLRGQLRGAAAQGIAGALFEELAYDEGGQPLTISFVDY